MTWAALLLLTACGPPIYECTDPLEPHHPPADSPVLHQEGQLLVTAGGEPVRLVGVNLGGWLMWEAWIWGAPLDLFHLDRQAESHVVGRLGELYGAEAAASFRDRIDREWVTAADLERIAALGFNVVRLPLNHTVVDNEVRLRLVDDLVDAAEAAGLWVVLDLHGAPGGQADLFTADPDETLLWEDDAARAATIATWARLSARYAEHPALAGYDLLNEPVPDSDAAYLSLLDDLLLAVRANDPDHLVFVEGTALARDFRLFTERLDENMVYEAHAYTALDGRAFDRIAGFAELQTCHDIPVWVGEFGEDNALRVQELRREIDARGLAGWAFWPWKKVDVGRYPGLGQIQAPADWTTLMSDLTAAPGKAGQLSWDRAAAALDGFVAASQPDTMALDDKVRTALTSQ